MAYGNVWEIDIKQGDKITVIFDLTLNSGQVPNIRLMDSTTAVSVTDNFSAAAGSNIITLTANQDSDARLRFLNSAASNFSTDKIVVKRAEVEADWIQLEGVEGSHNLREKKGADRFDCTLVLPENYTQTLGRVDV